MAATIAAAPHCRRRRHGRHSHRHSRRCRHHSRRRRCGRPCRHHSRRPSPRPSPCPPAGTRPRPPASAPSRPMPRGPLAPPPRPIAASDCRVRSGSPPNRRPRPPPRPPAASPTASPDASPGRVPGPAAPDPAPNPRQIPGRAPLREQRRVPPRVPGRIRHRGRRRPLAAARRSHSARGGCGPDARRRRGRAATGPGGRRRRGEGHAGGWAPRVLGRRVGRGGGGGEGSNDDAGPTEGGPGQCAAAERGRCRRPHASPGTVRVEVRPRRRGDRPISPGIVAEGSNGRGGGGAGSAKRGWTVGCQSRGTRAPQPRSGGVSVVVGRGATFLRRGVAAAPGRAVRAVPCRGRGAPSMEVEAERSASNYGK